MSLKPPNQKIKKMGFSTSEKVRINNIVTAPLQKKDPSISVPVGCGISLQLQQS